MLVWELSEFSLGIPLVNVTGTGNQETTCPLNGGHASPLTGRHTKDGLGPFVVLLRGPFEVPDRGPPALPERVCYPDMPFLMASDLWSRQCSVLP